MSKPYKLEAADPVPHTDLFSVRTSLIQSEPGGAVTASAGVLGVIGVVIMSVTVTITRRMTNERYGHATLRPCESVKNDRS